MCSSSAIYLGAWPHHCSNWAPHQSLMYLSSQHSWEGRETKNLAQGHTGRLAKQENESVSPKSPASILNPRPPFLSLCTEKIYSEYALVGMYSDLKITFIIQLQCTPFKFTLCLYTILLCTEESHSPSQAPLSLYDVLLINCILAYKMVCFIGMPNSGPAGALITWIILNLRYFPLIYFCLQ